MTHHKLYLKIQNQKHASAWSKGVSKYALELVEMLEQEGWETKEKICLTGLVIGASSPMAAAP